MQNSEEIWRLVDAKKEPCAALSDRIWGMPELACSEHRSVARHIAMLQAEGFRITRNLASIPTAVAGEAGAGGPVIAILGEYDALPGLSQAAGIAEPRPLEPDGNGHGCSHNLLGSAALLAATAVKDYLAGKGIAGRVRHYGCPAEEGGAAKGFMVRAGCFDDVDIAISWHPSAFSSVNEALSLAHTRIDFSFAGRAAHAGRLAAPRSQRARCRRADECRRELHARAHAERCPHPLCLARCRRHRTQRRAGTRHRPLSHPRPRPPRIVPLEARGAAMMGSTDVGDVSRKVPTVQAGGATCAIGTPGHSWQLTAHGKTAAAHKDLAQVAKVMAGTAIDVLSDATLLACAKADHAARIARHPYVCPIPDDVSPPTDMSAAAE